MNRDIDTQPPEPVGLGGQVVEKEDFEATRTTKDDGASEHEKERHERFVQFLKKCLNIDESNAAVDNLASQWVKDGIRFPSSIPCSKVKPSKNDFSEEEIKKISQCVDQLFIEGDEDFEMVLKCHKILVPFLKKCLNMDKSNDAVNNLAYQWINDGVKLPIDIPYSDVKPSKKDFSEEEINKILQYANQEFFKKDHGTALRFSGDGDNKVHMKRAAVIGGFGGESINTVTYLNRIVIGGKEQSIIAGMPEEKSTAQPEKGKKKSLDEAREKPLMKDGQKSQQADQTPPSGYNEKYDADDKTEISNESEPHPELAGGQAQSRLISLDSCVSYYPNERLSEESRVYKGRQSYIDGEFDCEIAFKVIPAAENNRYMREVENMKHVTGHPNVVQYFQCGRTENSNVGDFYIVLDLCQKETLGDIDLKKITLDERKKVFVQICRGVQHSHDRKVAHKDLRPRHILFSRDGKNAVIAGFGRSRKFKEGEDPVSCFGEDIFRLGCLGVYVLTSFAEGHTESYWDANSHEMSTPKLDGLGPLEKDLFKRMLSHVPEERPSIDEVLHHCMFWSRKKTSQFLHDVYSYSRLSESLSEPLLVIDRYFAFFQEFPLQDVDKNQLLIPSHSQQLADEAGISGDWLETMIRIESEFETCKSEELRKVERLFGRKMILNENLNKLLDRWESKQSREQKETLYKRMKEWRHDTAESIIRKRERRWSMTKCLEDSSLKGLLKYLRSYSDKMEKLLEAFPKLVPFLIRNIGQDLEDEDKEEYLHAMPQVKNLCLTEETMPTIIKQTISGISCDRSLTHPVVKPEVAVGKEKRKFL